MDWKTNELKIPLNGKDYIISVTMHKVKNKLEVNCTNIIPKCDASSISNKVSQVLQDLSKDDILKKNA